MKRILGAVAALLAFSSLGHAAQVRFFGGFQVTGITGGECPDYNPTGNRFGAKLRPVISGVPDNETSASMTLFDPGFAQGFRVAGNFNTNFKDAETVSVGYGFGSSDGNFTTRVKFGTTDPSPITSDAKFVDVTGVIQGWDFQPDCKVSFRMTLQQDIKN